MNCFIKRVTAAISVLVGPCPALLKCIDVDVHTVYYWANKMMMIANNAVGETGGSLQSMGVFSGALILLIQPFARGRRSIV